MSNLVKQINFYGDNLVAVKDEKSGKIYAGVSYICKGIGLIEGQRDRQVKNIQEDLVLNKGSKKLPVKFDGQVRNVLTIDINFLPLWLAKITITPKMQKEQPEITDKLIKYQLKAKDVLADAFLNKPVCIEDVMIQSLQEMKDLRLQLQQTKQQTVEVKQEIQSMRDVITLNPTQWRKDTTTLINKMALISGGYDHIKAIREESYKLLNERFGVDVKTRVTNKRRRMADEGVCKSRRDKLTVLDVIQDDKKLIEGYVAIIKEMSIKYKAA